MYGPPNCMKNDPENGSVPHVHSNFEHCGSNWMKKSAVCNLVPHFSHIEKLPQKKHSTRFWPNPNYYYYYIYYKLKPSKAEM